MQRNKSGLADLKKLREAISPTEPAAPERAPTRVSRKRSPFLPPGKASGNAPGAQSPGGSNASTARAHGSAGIAAPVAKPSTKAKRKAESPGARGQGAMSPPPAAAAAAAAAAAGGSLSESDRKLFLSAVRYVEKIKDPKRVILPPVSFASETILKERRLRAAGIDPKAEKAIRATPVAAPETETPGLVPRDANRGSEPPVSTRAGKLSDTYAPSPQHQDDSRFLRPGHGPEILRDLQRGRWPIGASLDLHGSTLEDARDRFERFLSSCLTHDVKCVRIIHGKGYGSPNGDAVLKTTVRRWLAQLDDVIAYVECSEPDGGAGAVQVLLK